MRLLFLILCNALGLMLASWLVPGFVFELPSDYLSIPFWLTLFSASFILLFVTKIIRPLLKILLFPVILLTFGIMSFMINLGLLWVYTLFIPQISVDGLWSLIWASIIISIINTIFQS